MSLVTSQQRNGENGCYVCGGETWHCDWCQWTPGENGAGADDSATSFGPPRQHPPRRKRRGKAKNRRPLRDVVRELRKERRNLRMLVEYLTAELNAERKDANGA